MSNPILGFYGCYQFLSNFYSSDVAIDGIVYPSVEAAFQASKTLDHVKRIEFASLYDPKEAKRAGHHLELRSDWEEVKLGIMIDLVQQKFTNDQKLADQLWATGDAYLEETNYWKDTFWSVCDGVGTNWLGLILMAMRRVVSHKDKGAIEEVL